MDAMIRIAVTAKAFDAIVVGGAFFEPAVAANGDRFIWLEPRWGDNAHGAARQGREQQRRDSAVAAPLGYRPAMSHTSAASRADLAKE
jgi:hypothetical protein